jgi:hypothetical protein
VAAGVVLLELREADAGLEQFFLGLTGS